MTREPFTTGAHKCLVKGNYAEAKDLYEQVIRQSNNLELEQNSLYNMAHAVNQMGEAAYQEQDFEAAVENWSEAEQLFRSANELNPEDTSSLEDADKVEARRKALEEFLQQQQSQEQQPQDSEQNDQQQEPQDSESESSENEQSSKSLTFRRIPK